MKLIFIVFGCFVVVNVEFVIFFGGQIFNNNIFFFFVVVYDKNYVLCVSVNWLFFGLGESVGFVIKLQMLDKEFQVVLVEVLVDNIKKIIFKFVSFGI